MTKNLAELLRYRELLYMISDRDIRIKYKQSVMGFLWAVLMPALVVAAGIMVKFAYSFASGKPLELSDAASVAVKAVPWAFFVGSLRFANTSLVSNTNLVTKIYFPKEIFPFAAVASQLFDLAIASAALALVLAVTGVGASWYLLWLPVLVSVLVILAAGASTIAAATSLFFRDVKYIVEVFLTFGIFFTPVFYDAELFGDRAKWVMLNPLAPVLEGIRSVVVLHHPPDVFWLSYSAVIGVTVMMGSYVVFKKLEPGFAENI